MDIAIQAELLEAELLLRQAEQQLPVEERVHGGWPYYNPNANGEDNAAEQQ
jgi:hypothetical protein